MTHPRFRLLIALALLPLVSAAALQEDYAAPYRILQQANLKLDSSLAASAYTSDGTLIFEYPGQPVETFKGTDTIRAAYVRTFGQVDPGTPIDLDFRFEPPGLSSARQTGAYRFGAKVGGRDITVYGRFSVELVKQDGAWRFAKDRGTVATAADFNKLPNAGLE